MDRLQGFRDDHVRGTWRPTPNPRLATWLTGWCLLVAAGLAQPSRYGMVAIGKFLEVDAFLQRHRLVGANAVDDVLKTEPGGRCEHDQRTANEAVLARPPRVVVAFATVLRPGHRAETQR